MEEYQNKVDEIAEKLGRRKDNKKVVAAVKEWFESTFMPEQYLIQKDRLITQRTESKRQLDNSQQDLAKVNAEIIANEVDLFDKMLQAKLDLKSALTEFSWGYGKNGEFINQSDMSQIKKLEESLDMIRKSIFKAAMPSLSQSELDKIWQLSTEEKTKILEQALSLLGKDSKVYLEYIENLQNKELEAVAEISKMRLEALNEERNAAINNLKSMYDFVKSTIKYSATTQSAVSASSLKAVEYQSRQFEGINKTELAPIIENQKQVRIIEQKMLKVQEETREQLKGIRTAADKTSDQLAKVQGIRITVPTF